MKKIIILVVIVLLSGCSLKYNIEIKKDLSLKEEIIMTEKHINLFIDPEEEIEELKQLALKDPSYRGFDFYLKKTSENVSGVGAKEYPSLKDFCDSFEVKEEMFTECNIVENNNEVSIKLMLNTTSTLFEETLIEEPLFKYGTVNITIPFKVVSNNADQIKKNVYTWKYDVNNYNKDISFIFNTSSKHINTINYPIYILGGIIGVAVIFGTYLYIIYKKNNVF